MKKFLKMMTIALATLLLVACGNKDEQPTASIDEASSEQASDQAAPASTESEASQASDAQASDASTDESAATSGEEETTGDEVTGDSVKVTLYVTGETEPHATFEVPYEEGMNVLETLEAQSEVDFNFNEDEGVIDMIDGIENDYALGHTWAYLLNGAFAELGVVSQTLEAGDEISWYYGTIDEIPINIIPAEGDTLPAATSEETPEADNPATE